MPTSLLTTSDAQTLRFAAVAREYVENLGKRIRERRVELGLSQDELARKVGLKATGNYVSRWERGVVEPEGDYLELVAKALETSVGDLMSGPKADRSKSETPDLMGKVKNEADLRAEVQELKDMLNGIATAIEGLSTQLEATSEQSAARFESLRAELAKRARRAA